jgi:hypothetical protein
MLLESIDRDGFFYKTAYPFSYKPHNVHICIVPWRFLAFGFIRLLASLVIWTIMSFCGLILGILIAGFSFFVSGKRLTYGRALPPPDFIIGGRWLNRVTIFNYDLTPIMHWPTRRTLPLEILIMLGAVWLMYSATPAIGGKTQDLISTLQKVVMNLIHYLTIFGVIAASLFIVVTFYWMIRKFLHTETGMVFREFVKAKINKVCPVIPVI